MIDRSALVAYALEELRGGLVYRPRTQLLAQINAWLPRAHLIIVSAAWCKDCRREIPKLARLLEHLPGWTIELRGDDELTRCQLGVRAIPTIVVQGSASGAELGRIIEAPRSESLEGDLLAIAERAAAPVRG